MDPFPVIASHTFPDKATSIGSGAILLSTDSDTHYSGNLGALMEVKPIVFIGENDNISQWIGNSEKEIVFRIPHYHHFDVLWGIDGMDIVYTPLLNLLQSQIKDTSG